MSHFITTDEQLRQLLPTAADVRLAFLQSYFERAEFQLLRPWLGQAQLVEFHALAGSATATEPQQQALALLRQALATYGARLYAAQSQQVLTGNGPRRLSTADQKALTPDELSQHLAETERQAYAELDALLVLLEQYPDEFAAWHAGSTCTIWADHFFQDADQLALYASGEMSRIRFRGLWPQLNQAELQYIRRLLGPALYQRLLTEQHQAEHRELVALIRTALAAMVAGDELASDYASGTLEEIRQLLQDGLATWPEFAQSSQYQPPVADAPQDNNFYAFY